MKCVPLNVERKLYSATLFVMLVTPNVAFSLYRSPWKRLSHPPDMSNVLWGAMRCGFRSGLNVPGAGMLNSGDDSWFGAQLVSGFASVARWFPQVSSICCCWSGVRYVRLTGVVSFTA